ncbi:Uncharacterised protein [uncultured archaeon]|nr:Uncharacterised protein [uncultured archaeon]
MGTLDLATIRQRLTQSEQSNNGNDSTVFQFWNQPTGSTSVIRFVNDADPANEFFWTERQYIRLPFNGIVNGDTKPITVSVPCLEMYPKSEYPSGDSILNEVRAWFKEATASNDEELKKKATTYWKKYQYFMAGFVRETSLKEDNLPENPIRRFILNKQLFNTIKQGMIDPEMVNVPCDYEHGTDFRIVKSTKGEYADYSSSNYSRHESALTKDELDAIEKYGLPNLSDFLGKKPTEKDLEVIQQMFEASVNGEAYDGDKWGAFYHPSGFKANSDFNFGNSETQKESSEIKTEQKVETKAEVKEEPKAESAPAHQSAAELIEMLKRRNAAKKA